MIPVALYIATSNRRNDIFDSNYKKIVFKTLTDAYEQVLKWFNDIPFTSNTYVSKNSLKNVTETLKNNHCSNVIFTYDCDHPTSFDIFKSVEYVYDVSGREIVQPKYALISVYSGIRDIGFCGYYPQTNHYSNLYESIVDAYNGLNINSDEILKNVIEQGYKEVVKKKLFDIYSLTELLNLNHWVQAFEVSWLSENGWSHDKEIWENIESFYISKSF